MLRGNLYDVTDLLADESSLTAVLKLNLNHTLFGGHFPGQPVMPGVCLLQIVKEVSEMNRQHKMQLTEADYLKFIALIVPDEHQLLILQIKFTIAESGQIKTAASITAGGNISFKFQGLFKKM